MMDGTGSATANVQALDGFIRNLHKEPYNAILPRSNPLKSPFHVVVIGATGAIGRAIAISYAQAGASHITLAARRVEVLEDLAGTLRSTVSPDGSRACDVRCVDCDIGSATSVSALGERLRSEPNGRLDAVVLVSGISGPVTLSLTEGDPETFERVTKTNYLGTYHAFHFLLPLLTGTKDGSKTFIVISSMAAAIVTGTIASAQYCVSKTAQLRLVEYAHEQFREDGVLILAVHPGAVASENALEMAPESFRQYLTDSPDLAGGWCVWLCRERAERAERVEWMGGRLLSATWDVEELVRKKEEVMKADLLKLRVNC